MKNLTLNNLAKITDNNASAAHVIRELGLLENNTFTLNFNYLGCDIYDVNLMFDNIKLSARIVCASSDLPYLAFMEVFAGWQFKINR